MSTSPTVTEQQSSPSSTAASAVAMVLLPFAIYAAFALHLGLWAGFGFSVAVPSVIGSTLAALISSARA